MREPETNPEMPKCIREVLAKQTTQGPHPDADLLTAYAERVLSAREGADVAGHLAGCAECRAVMFLASTADEEPVSEIVATPAPSRTTRGWLRWAMPATAALALAMSVLVVRQGSFRNPETATKQAATLPASNPAETSTFASESKKTETKAQEKTAGVNAATGARSKPSLSMASKDLDSRADRSKGVGSGVSSKAVVVGGVLESSAGEHSLEDRAAAPPRAKSLANAAIAVPVPQGQPIASDVIAPAAPAVSNASKVNSVSGGPSRMQSQANYSNAQYMSRGAQAMAMEVPDAYVVNGPNNEQKVAPMRLEALQKQKNSLFSAPLRWRISAQGYLERLVGDAWHPAMSSARKTFRTVAVMGSHVWAGGPGPDIVHSPDDGNSWATIRVGTDKEPLTGTVKTIRADDPWHLAVITDTGNTWTTNDGGVTWNKQ